MTRRVVITCVFLCSAASCIPRPQPMTLVLTVPPQPARPADTRPVYVTVPSPASSPAVVPEQRPVLLPHTIQSFDLLEIVVGDGASPAMTDELQRVQADGSVRLINVGLVHVGGLDKAGAEAAVSEQIVSRQVLAHPVVTISRRQPASAAAAPRGPIAPGDVVRLVVHDLKGPGTVTTLDSRINLAGQMDVPQLGLTKVAGMTDPQAADALVAAYADRQILVKALLDLTTLEKAPPGIDPLDWPTTVIPAK